MIKKWISSMHLLRVQHFEEDNNSKRGGHLNRSKGGKRQDRNAPAKLTKPAKDGQTTMTVTVPQETNHFTRNVPIEGEARTRVQRNSQNKSVLPQNQCQSVGY